MSYILDALRKAEQQRDLGQVPGLATEHERPESPLARRWPWIVAALVAVNLLLLVLFLSVVRERQAASVPTSANAPGATSAPASQAADARPAVPPPASTPASADGAPVPGTSVPAQAPDPPASAAVSLETPAAPRPLIPLPLPSTAPAGAAATAPDTPPRDRTVAEPDVDRTPTAPPTPTTQGQQPLPVYPLIADDVYARIQGRLELNMHVYSSNRDGRFVLLNMKKYNEGERLFEGPVLEQITEDGIILSMDGNRFRIRAP